MTGTKQTYNQVQLDIAKKLSGVSNTPLIDARMLICHICDISFEQMLLNRDELMSSEEYERLHEMVDLRLKSMPIAKIIGKKEFYGEEFKVDQNVLDPRPETEHLIDEILHINKTSNFKTGLELGVGSGCICITLVKQINDLEMLAGDISPQAIEIANYNAQHLNVIDKLEIIESSWFDKITGKYDFIVSNPPYIDDEGMAKLDKDVIKYDPNFALYGGEDGLDPYRIITSKAHEYLNADGWLFFEIGYNQGPQIVEIMQEHNFQHINLKQDLAGNDRVVYGQYLEKNT